MPESTNAIVGASPIVCPPPLPCRFGLVVWLPRRRWPVYIPSMKQV